MVSLRRVSTFQPANVFLNTLGIFFLCGQKSIEVLQTLIESTKLGGLLGGTLLRRISRVAEVVEPVLQGPLPCKGVGPGPWFLSAKFQDGSRLEAETAMMISEGKGSITLDLWHDDECRLE